MCYPCPRTILLPFSPDHTSAYTHTNMKRKSCMNCGGQELHEFLDLKPQPNGNRFPGPTDAEAEPLYPMSMLVCTACWLVQIAEFPPSALLFEDHPYITGVNVPVVEHFKRLVPRLVKRFELQPNDLALDIGCNDGTLLKEFAASGLQVLGVDPCKGTWELARQAGVTVFRTFWNRAAGEALSRLSVVPDIITSTASFYHVPDLHDFVAGVDLVMGPKTIFMVQGVYLKNLIERNQFDHFYHEHSCVHSVGPLRRLFAEHGMRILDLEFSELHGGSFVVTVAKNESPWATDPAVEEAIKAEEQAGLNSLDRVRDNADRLVAMLRALKADGKRVFALGAPVKGSTLLNFCGIGPDLIECATEINVRKIGRLMPGTRIPIVDETALTSQPDYYLVLTWNFLEFLRQRYDGFLRAGGRFIAPVPEVSIVGPAERLPGANGRNSP
ncbi:MAG: hypothetical protein HW416_3556 [Chloroflexi bacterium]|nr:hypothetical protein [Chloroflexota bacterium]